MSKDLLLIAGPSSSGKTTIARLVAESTGARLLHLDRYWIAGCEKPLVNGHPSREQPHQYDGAALAAEIDAALSDGSGTPVVAEGFLIFAYPEILELDGTRAYVDVPHPELVRRRLARVAKRTDGVRVSYRDDIEQAWHAHGWDEWRAFGSRQAGLPGVALVDGLLPPKEVAERLLARWGVPRLAAAGTSV